MSRARCGKIFSVSWAKNIRRQNLCSRVVIRDGKLVVPFEPLGLIRERFAKEWETLPLAHRDLQTTGTYPVRISAALDDLEARTAREKTKQEIMVSDE